jgi:two-component system, cell cycle sensor histidine kinase and response regulator CckA
LIEEKSSNRLVSVTMSLASQHQLNVKPRLFNWLERGFQPVTQANQVLTSAMETTGAIASVSGDTERAVSVTPWATGGLALAAASLVVGGLVLLAGPDAIGLAMLSLLAIIGLFAGFGVLAGYIRLDARSQLDAIERLAAAHAEPALEIVGDDGSTVFANPAAEQLRHGASSIEAYLSAIPAVSDSAYRLIAAARRGQIRREDIFVPAGIVDGQARAAQWLRVSVQPVKRPALTSQNTALAIWSATDVTADRQREAATTARLSEQIAFFDHMSVGVAALRDDGTFVHTSSTLKRLLGHDSAASRQTTLVDILSPDMALLVKASLAAGRSPARFEVDMLREDGTALAVHLIAEARAASSKHHTITVLARQSLAVPGESAPLDDRFARMFHAAPFGIATIDAAGAVINANAGFSRLFPERDDARHAIVKRLTAGASSDQKTQVESAIVRALAGRVNAHPVEVGSGAEGDQAARRLYVAPLTAGIDPRECAVIFVADASEQKELEAKFAQSQKMEAIGKLAGGIAHDFNNVLQVIIGLSDLMTSKQRPTDPGYREFKDIGSNAQRAAGMVRQLLAFSRKQTLEPETLNVNEALQDFAFNFKKTIGEKVDIKHVPTRHLWPIRADRTQLDQVLMNLAVNARDAMPTGGRLTLRTKNVTARESLKHGGLGMTAGEYVLIEVEDSGSGMSADVMAKIFEPFFTTKDVGKGTGLGLSTVYGIVKQTGGFIYPESELGKGTTFRVFLPRHIPTEEEEAAVEAAADAKKKEPTRDLTGTGRVLLVEDEDGVRNFAVRALQRQGYDVLEAVTGAEALDVLAEAEGMVDVVVSDVIMPEMDGPTMYKEMLKTHPNLKIIFVSGYPRDAFDKSLDADTPFHFLAKPFTLPQLAAKVKEVLDE